MLYTDNVNKLIWYIFLPSFFIFFAVYVYFETLGLREDNKFNEEIIQEHIFNFNKPDKKKEFQGLILGGSNSLFSLSAEILSEQSGKDWYNLSLLNEGVSKENYFKFLKEFIPENIRLNIEEIVYSSIVPFRKDLALQRKDNNRDLYGNPGYLRLPQKKFITFIKERLNNFPKETRRFPLPNKFGDLIFSEESCPEIKDSLFEHEMFDRAIIWTREVVNRTESLFPNATIFFVYPSQYHPDSAEEEKGKNVFFKMKESDLNLKNHIHLIYQTQFSKLDLICDDYHHANEIGRDFRTKDLHINILNYQQMLLEN
ncbi:hypothetical protein M9C82_06165 [SAR86 cluster bacterium]|nr:hypothetical protein M9C82_06165 [SAR86 cluster bacterium]